MNGRPVPAGSYRGIKGEMNGQQLQGSRVMGYLTISPPRHALVYVRMYVRSWYRPDKGYGDNG